MSITHIRALRLTVAIAVSAASTTGSANAQAVDMLDARAWRGHFEAWVDRALVRDERRSAIEALAPVGGTERWQAMHAWLDELATQLPPAELPPRAIPGLRLQGLRGPAIEAARTAVKGDRDAALEALAKPDLLLSADATHLRAQLLDEASLESSPAHRLASIGEYRYAISLAPETAHAARARVRIAQIYLGLGWGAEASAELRPYLHEPLPEPFALPAQLTFTAASLRGEAWREALDSANALLGRPQKSEVQRYALQARGDALFALARHAEAAATYAVLVKSSASDDAPPDPARLLRLSFALDELGQVNAARDVLRPLAASAPGTHWGAIAALMLARFDLRDASLAAVQQTFDTLLRADPEPRFAALAGFGSVELARQRGEPVALLPSAVEPLVDRNSSDPGIALLSYQATLLEAKHTAKAETRARFAEQIKALDEGPVRELIVRELATRALRELGEDLRADRASDAVLLDHAQEMLEPDHLGPEMLTVATEAFYAARRHAACSGFARELEKRDPRPIRRGLAVWRQVLCDLASGELAPGGDVAAIEASGRAGPFGLAVAVLYAEHLLAEGAEAEAAERYARALLALGEPQLIGPVLLRAGTLAARRGETSVAVRNLTRGLTVTTNLKLADDPLRKAAIVALSRLARESGSTAPLRQTVLRERRHVEPWWVNAYAYLGHRVGAARPPEGEDLFARASRSLRETEALEARLERILRKNQRALARTGSRR